MTIAELVEMAARSALRAQKVDGSLPPGSNGPHRDPETPVRVTSHWLISFASLYRYTGEPGWRQAVERAAGYLRSSPARPGAATFHHRTNPRKDGCNGLIGQAWTIEALAAAADVLEDADYTNLAEEVFLLHPFDDRLGLWRRIEVDGRMLGFDQTFNHQLWFAAAASLVQGPRRREVLSRCSRFLECCERSLKVLPDGLIHHAIPARLFFGSAERVLPLVRQHGVESLPRILLPNSDRARRDEVLRKSIGYQAFNLYAFAMLKREMPNHPFWERPELRSAVRYASSEAWIRELESNPYGYPYNPPGFEVPVALSSLDGLAAPHLAETTKEWVERQLERTLTPGTPTLGRNNPDPVTLTARLYEATRLEKALFCTLQVNAREIRNAS